MLIVDLLFLALYDLQSNFRFYNLFIVTTRATFRCACGIHIGVGLMHVDVPLGVGYNSPNLIHLRLTPSL